MQEMYENLLQQPLIGFDPVNPENTFKSIADGLMKDYCIKCGNKEFYLAEIEFSLVKPGLGQPVPRVDPDLQQFFLFLPCEQVEEHANFFRAQRHRLEDQLGLGGVVLLLQKAVKEIDHHVIRMLTREPLPQQMVGGVGKLRGGAQIETADS